MRLNKTTFIHWIKEPSTIKAILIVVSLIGVTIEPERLQEIVYAFAILYAGISGLWDTH